MPEPEAAIERFALAHRKDAGGRRDAPIPHHDSAIVERGFRMENRQKKLDRKMGVENHTGFFVNADRSVALDRDERAELFVRQLRHRFRNIMDGLALLARQRENRVAAKLRQTTAQLRLKNHHERYGQEDGETANDPADDNEIQQLRNQGQGQKDDRQTGQHLGAAGPAKVEIAIINPDAEQNNFGEASPSLEPDLNEVLDHFAVSRSASVTRNAAAFSFTS